WPQAVTQTGRTLSCPPRGRVAISRVTWGATSVNMALTPGNPGMSRSNAGLPKDGTPTPAGDSTCPESPVEMTGGKERPGARGAVSRPAPRPALPVGGPGGTPPPGRRGRGSSPVPGGGGGPRGEKRPRQQGHARAGGDPPRHGAAAAPDGLAPPDHRVDRR